MRSAGRIICSILLSGIFGGLTIVKADTLYFNRGQFVSYTQDTIPAVAYNTVPSYNKRNAILIADPAMALDLVVINNDTATHGFAVKGITSGNIILPGASLTLSLTLPAGVYPYYDDYLYPRYSAMGAAGMIVSGVSGDKAFFWNLQSLQQSWNEDLAVGLPVDWTNHYPDFFTINGNSYPDTEMDSTAYITGNVGDTLMIYVANNSRIIHSLHFHGYHVRIVQYSQSSAWIGRIKDTVPIRSGETMTLELVPDKPGMFPVHDHELLAVTSKKWYPYGLRTMIEIQ
jgi:hypothetical protein